MKKSHAMTGNKYRNEGVSFYLPRLGNQASTETKSLGGDLEVKAKIGIFALEQSKKKEAKT